MNERNRLRRVFVMASLPAQAESELIERLTTIRTTSPFATVPGTHSARLIVLGRDAFDRRRLQVEMSSRERLLGLLMKAGRPQREDRPPTPYLMFAAGYDSSGLRGGSAARYIDGLRQALRERADHIWGLCHDYPGWVDRPAFNEFFARRSLRSFEYFQHSDHQPTVEAVSRTTARHYLLRELALNSDGQPSAVVAARLRQAFRADPPA